MSAGQLFLDVSMILAAVVLLWKGSEWLVDAASRIARYLGMSDLAIGLTVVSLGTPAPEFAPRPRWPAPSSRGPRSGFWKPRPARRHGLDRHDLLTYGLAAQPQGGNLSGRGESRSLGHGLRRQELSYR